jgi:lysophospholipase L1-like esterase
MNKDNLNQPVIILGITIILLTAVSFLPEEMILFGVEIKHVDILADIRAEEEEQDFLFDEYWEDDESDSLDVDSAYTDDDDLSMISETNEMTKAEFRILNDAVYMAGEFLESESEKINEYNNFSNVRTNDEPISGNTSQLKNFFRALDRTSSKKVRIAHYGDSGIEGDLVTADLREIMQAEFGGGGVGYLPIYPEGMNYRQSTSFSHSDNWKMYGINSRNPKRLPVGVNGEVFINEGRGWFEYETNNRFRHSRYFDEVKLFYSNASGSLEYSINGSPDKAGELYAGENIKALTVSRKSSKSIKFKIPNPEQGYFYGLSLENGPGVYIDNFAFRGNSGVDLRDIPIENLQEFDILLEYNLIIFQFGLNALSARNKNYKRYEKDMIKVVEHFQKAFPHASFIMISSQDKSVKKSSKFQTDPQLENLIQAQINIARETKIAFWNLFEAMGGKNSMVNWVNANPSLAYKDYIHFNEAGVKKVASLFSEALLELYN